MSVASSSFSSFAFRTISVTGSTTSSATSTVPAERPGVQIRLERQVVSGGNDRPREPVSPFGVPHQSFTYVSQWTYFSFSPLVAAKNAPWSSLVTGPRWPSPTTRSSTSRIGVISAAVPVKKHSSAL